MTLPDLHRRNGYEAEEVSMDEQIRYRTSERFILRKEEDGRYKILGWQIVEDAGLDEH